MALITILRGLPASGKTTFALSYMELKRKNNSAHTVARVSRDDIREMMTAIDENLVTKIEQDLVLTFADTFDEVIIDATHLRPKYITRWRNLLEHKHEIEVLEVPVTLEQSLFRNATRAEPVPEKVIRRMYGKYTIKGKFLPETPFTPEPVPRPVVEDTSKPGAFIFDLDGTLAHMDGKRGPFEYHKVDGDRVDNSIRAVLHALREAGYEIIFMSGREATRECTMATIDWLKDNNIAHDADELFMRGEGDYRGDEIVKEELFRKFVEPRYNVIGVFDDRPRVCRMWHMLGLKLFKVGDPDERDF